MAIGVEPRAQRHAAGNQAKAIGLIRGGHRFGTMSDQRSKLINQRSEAGVGLY